MPRRGWLRLGVVLLSIATASLSSHVAIADDDPPSVPAHAVGDRVDAFTLESQHGDPVDVDANTRLVLFSRDMDGGKLLKAALADVPAEALSRQQAVYVADISGMPSMVARLFALPAMRRRPYAVGLDREGATTARLPDVEGAATLIHLDALRIERIQHAHDTATIRASLGLDQAGSARDAGADGE